MKIIGFRLLKKKGKKSLKILNLDPNQSIILINVLLSENNKSLVIQNVHIRLRHQI